MRSNEGGNTAERVLKTWEDFQKLLREQGFFKGGGYRLYRGQASSKWGLEPSLLRKLRDFEYTDVQAREVEKEATRAFQNHAFRYMEGEDLEFAKPDKDQETWFNDLKTWAVMQHYGAPTRLLDWTESPYVALYSAVNDRPSEEGALWFFNKVAFNIAITKIHKTTDLKLLVEEADNPPSDNRTPRMHWYAFPDRTMERLFRQQGAFTLCSNILSDHKDVLIEVGEKSGIDIGFGRVEIEARAKSTFLGVLRRMNVTGPALFTGIQGLVTHVSDMVMLDGPTVGRIGVQGNGGDASDGRPDAK